MKTAIAPTIAPIKVPVEIELLLDDDGEAAPPADGLVVGLVAGADAPVEVTTTLEPGTRAGASDPAAGADVGAAPLKRKLVSVLVPEAVAPPVIPAIDGTGGGAPFCRLCCRALLGTCMATGYVVCEGSNERLGFV